MALTAEEYEDQTVKTLKTSVAKRIGVPRFRQRWLGEDHNELKDDALVTACDVQLIVLEFVQTEDGEVQKLFDACKRNLLEKVDELLRKPMNPEEVVPSRNKNALQIAANSGHVECVALLLEAGANKDAANSDGITALHRAARMGHAQVVQLLLEAGADKNAADSDRRTGLHFAAQHGHREVVHLLLAAGAIKDGANNDRETALHLAASHGHLRVVRLLLEFRADKDVVASNGRSALHFAVQNGHLEVAQLLQPELER